MFEAGVETCAALFVCQCFGHVIVDAITVPELLRIQNNNQNLMHKNKPNNIFMLYTYLHKYMEIHVVCVQTLTLAYNQQAKITSMNLAVSILMPSICS